MSLELKDCLARFTTREYSRIVIFFNYFTIISCFALRKFYSVQKSDVSRVSNILVSGCVNNFFDVKDEMNFTC